MVPIRSYAKIAKPYARRTRIKLIDVEIPSREEYDRLADEYLAGLPLEHFMEDPDTAAQRIITGASFRVISRYRPDIVCFNEILVQYPRDDGSSGQVVPDAMIAVEGRPVPSRKKSYKVPYEESSIIMVIEYVSSGAANRRKHYEENRERYEQELKVPYYLLFDPHPPHLTILSLIDGMYEDVEPNAAGRYAVDELDLEIAIWDEWVRFWFKGELVPLPEESIDERDAANKTARRESLRANREKRRADLADQKADLADQKSKLAGQRASDEAAKAAKFAAMLRALGIDPNG